MAHATDDVQGPDRLLGREVPVERRAVPPAAVLGVAAFGAFLAFLDSTIVNIAFPDVQRDFAGADLGRLSWVLNSYNIVFAAFLVVAGRMADLLGRRRTFTGGVVVFTVASGLCALAPTVDVLIAARVLQALGAAALVPASLAVVVEAFPPERRAHAVGLWGASAALAAGLGPPIGGALVEASSWRLAFLVNLPLGVLAVLVARRGLVESRAPGRRLVPDLRGAALLALALALLTTSLVKAEDWGWAGTGTLVAAALGMLCLVGFVLSSRASASPVLDPALLRVPSFVVANLVTLVAAAGFYAYLLTHVLWLYYVWDYSLLRAGLALAPGALVAAVVAAVLGKVADRHGARVVALPGAVVWACGLAWYLQRVGTEPAFLAEWLPGQLVSGLGVGATLPVVGSAAVIGISSSSYASAAAVVSSTRQLGAVIGVALLVVLVGTPTPLTAVEAFRDGWTFSVVCLTAAAVGLLFLRPPRSATLVDEAEPVVPQQRAEESAVARPAAPEEVGTGDVLAGAPLFRGLSPEALAWLRQDMTDVVLRAGEELFCQGDPADALYVVESGQVEVMRDGEVVAQLGRGACFGELGLLSGGTRAGTVRGRRDSRLLRLSSEQFAVLGAVEPSLLQGVAQTLAGWLTTSRPRATGTRPVVVSVIALDADAPAEQVARRLGEHLSRHLRVVLPGRLEADGLARAERDHDRVLLVADAPGVDDAWRSFCLRQADRVVLVATAAAGVPDRPVAPRESGADLVIVGRQPRQADVRAWHDAYSPTTCCYAEGALSACVRALAARLAGRSIGLVLGGGGARAFAHLGVLDELEASGIVVDRVAGASLGACVAACYATGMTADQVDATCYEYFVRRNPAGDWTLPTKALTRGRRTVRLLEDFFGDALIEELPREFVGVSVDLLSRERVEHRRGRLADVTAASMRVPVLTPPLLLDGRLHVDGGVLDNLPVDVLQQRDEGPVMAVSISFGSSGSSSGRAPRIPSIGDTVMRAMTLSSGKAGEAALAAADLVVRPPSNGVGLLEWHQLDAMRASGREAARAVLATVDSQLRPLATPYPEPSLTPA